MNTIKNLLPVLFAAIIFSACQKQLLDETGSTTTTTTTSAARPKTYTEDITYSSGSHVVVTFNLSYDAANRLTSMISATSPGDKLVYQYSSNKVTLDIYNSGVVDIHELFFLNASNFIDSTFQYNSTADTMTEKYYYNSSAQLVKINQYDYSTRTGAVLTDTDDITYDANGNAIKEVDTNAGTTTYTYTSIAFNFSMGFDLGPVGKYFINTAANGGITYTHIYTFDTSNRLTKDKLTGSDGTVLIKSYTY